MAIETLAVKAVEETVKGATDVAKGIWSVLDAAADKPAPSQYLSQAGIRAIQGVGSVAQEAARSAL
jgi:hypothetical protein